MPSIQDPVHKFEEKGGRGMGWRSWSLPRSGWWWCTTGAHAKISARRRRWIPHRWRAIWPKGAVHHPLHPPVQHLVKSHNQGRLIATDTNARPDYAQLKGMHPDLANPPAVSAHAGRCDEGVAVSSFR